MTLQPTTTRPAGRGARIGAYLIDLVLCVAMGALAWLAWRSWALSALVVVEAGLVIGLVVARTGRSPGGRLTRVVSTRAGTDLAPGLRRQAVRSIGIGLLQLTLVGPLVTLLTSRDGRDWLDRLAGTAALDTRPLPAPPQVGEDAYGRPSAAREDAWQGPPAVAGPGPGLPSATPSVNPPTAAPVVAGPGPAAPVAPGLSGPAPVAPGLAGPAPVAPSLPGTPAAGPVVPAPAYVGPPAAMLPGQPQAAPPVPAPEPPMAAVPAPRPAVPPVAARLPVWIVLDSGARAEVRGVVVLGRAPASSGAPDEIALAVPDSTRSLSRTHARVGLDEAGVWVEDLFSANGSAITTPDGRTEELPRGQRVHVASGTVLAMGERTLTITVEGGA